MFLVLTIVDVGCYVWAVLCLVGFISMVQKSYYCYKNKSMGIDPFVLKAIMSRKAKKTLVDFLSVWIVNLFLMCICALFWYWSGGYGPIVLINVALIGFYLTIGICSYLFYNTPESTLEA